MAESRRSRFGGKSPAGSLGSSSVMPATWDCAPAPQPAVREAISGGNQVPFRYSNICLGSQSRRTRTERRTKQVQGQGGECWIECSRVQHYSLVPFFVSRVRLFVLKPPRSRDNERLIQFLTKTGFARGALRTAAPYLPSLSAGLDERMGPRLVWSVSRSLRAGSWGDGFHRQRIAQRNFRQMAAGHICQFDGMIGVA